MGVKGIAYLMLHGEAIMDIVEVPHREVPPSHFLYPPPPPPLTHALCTPNLCAILASRARARPRARTCHHFPYEYCFYNVNLPYESTFITSTMQCCRFRSGAISLKFLVDTASCGLEKHVS